MFARARRCVAHKTYTHALKVKLKKKSTKLIVCVEINFMKNTCVRLCACLCMCVCVCVCVHAMSGDLLSPALIT